MTSVYRFEEPRVSRLPPTAETTDFHTDEGSGVALLANVIFWEEDGASRYYERALESAFDTLRIEAKVQEWRQLTQPATYSATKYWRLLETARDAIGAEKFMAPIIVYLFGPRSERNLFKDDRFSAALPSWGVGVGSAGQTIRIMSIMQNLEAIFGLSADIYSREDGGLVMDYAVGEDGRITMISRDDYLHVMGVVDGVTLDRVLVGTEITPSRVGEVVAPLLHGERDEA